MTYVAGGKLQIVYPKKGLRIFAQKTFAQTTFAAWQTPKRLLPTRLLPKTQESGNWQGSWHPDHMCCMLQSAFQDFTFTPSKDMLYKDQNFPSTERLCSDDVIITT